MELTNQKLNHVFENSGLSQIKFGKIIGFSQPHVLALLKSKNELRFSELNRIGNLFGISYDIVLKSDVNDFKMSLIEELKKLEISLIKEFSKEKDYDSKKLLEQKIDAIKTLLDN